MAVAVKEWLRTFPAVRVQHQNIPAGKGLEAWQDPDGSTWLKSLVVAEDAKRLVRRGVLTAYSVGMGDVVTSPNPNVKRYHITGFKLVECSLVDSPSNARCGIEIIGKSAGGVPRYSGKVFGVAKKPGKYRIDKAGQVVTKSGRVVMTKSQLAAIGEAAARETAWAGYLNSSDPWEREAAREVLSRGLHF